MNIIIVVGLLLGIVIIFASKGSKKESSNIETNQKKNYKSDIKYACPYCNSEFTKKSPPKRRSKFKCKSCSKQIHVEPAQFIYPSIYLTEDQAEYVYYLWQLDHWCFTMGSHSDYKNMKKKLVKKFGGEPSIGDIIWGLMNESIVKTCNDKSQMDDVKELMKDFKKWENEIKIKKNQGTLN